MADKLAEYAITAKDLILFAELTTKRAEFSIDEGLLALDESWYTNQHDYELELEVENSEKGKQDFKMLLDKFDITYRPAKNKIERAAYAQQ